MMAAINFKLRSQLLIIISLTLAVLFTITQLPLIGFDATRTKLHTVSDAAKNLLQALDEPVEVTLYFSSELATLSPQYGTYAGRVRDRLRQFAALSNGQLSLRFINPQSFSPEEDEAIALGLQGIDIGQGDRLYFGISAKIDDGEPYDPTHYIGATKEENTQPVTVLPLLQPNREAFLEYDLVKLIDGLSQQVRPTLGIITGTELFGAIGDQMRGLPPTPWAILGQAEEFYDVHEILNVADLIDQPPDLLVILHPTALEPRMVYAIEQYLFGGGKGILFYDAYHETADITAAATGITLIDHHSQLTPLLDHWGVTIDQTHIIGDRRLGQPVQLSATSRDAVPYPAWVAVTPDYQQTDLPLFANLESLMFPSAGAIELDRLNSDLGFTPLIWASEQAYKIPVERLREPDPLTIAERTKPYATPPVMAGLLTGKITSAFKDGAPEIIKEPPPETELKSEEAHSHDTGEHSHNHAELQAGLNAAVTEEANPFENHTHLNEGKIDLIVISDADLIADPFWVNRQSFLGQEILSPLNDNGALFLNLLDQAIGSVGFADLRGRGVAKAPFTVIHDKQAEAELRFRASEQALSQELNELEQTLSQLRQDQSPEDQQAILDETLNRIVETRSQLRMVNHQLRQEVEGLERNLTLLMTFTIPVILLGFMLYSLTARRRMK